MDKFPALEDKHWSTYKWGEGTLENLWRNIVEIIGKN